MCENVSSCRISDWAEGWLATEQCVLGGRLFSGIMLDGLVFRHYPQPVAFGGPIDRNADAAALLALTEFVNAVMAPAMKQLKREAAAIFLSLLRTVRRMAFFRCIGLPASKRNSVQHQQTHKYGRR